MAAILLFLDNTNVLRPEVLRIATPPTEQLPSCRSSFLFPPGHPLIIDITSYSEGLQEVVGVELDKFSRHKDSDRYQTPHYPIKVQFVFSTP